MIMNVDTVRGIIMETKAQNFSRVEYEGEQVLYCLRIKPLAEKYSFANLINESNDFRADVMYRKVDIYTCQESKGGWARYEE